MKKAPALGLVIGMKDDGQVPKGGGKMPVGDEAEEEKSEFDSAVDDIAEILGVPEDKIESLRMALKVAIHACNDEGYSDSEGAEE